MQDSMLESMKARKLVLTVHIGYHVNVEEHNCKFAKRKTQANSNSACLKWARKYQIKMY